MAEKTIMVYGSVEKMTPHAVLFTDGANKVWLPKSQISNLSTGGGVEFEIPLWLAKKKGLI